MIVFMQNNAGADTMKSSCLGQEIFIHKGKGYFFRTGNIFPDFWDTEAAFVVCPFFASQAFNMSVNKNPFDTGCISVFIFFIIFAVGKYLLAIHHKKPDILINLWG